MFVKLRMMTHEALKEYMHGQHAPLYGDTTQLVYDIIKTAEGYDDVVMLLSSKKYMPEDLRDLLTRYSIIHKED